MAVSIIEYEYYMHNNSVCIIMLKLAKCSNNKIYKSRKVRVMLVLRESLVLFR